MGNSRKLKRDPREHECSGDRKVISMHCPEHGHWELDVCTEGADIALAELRAEMISDCPVCGGEGTLAVRIGREWLGEPRFVWQCDNGCLTSTLRAALLKAGIEKGCLGTYAGPGERTALYRMYGRHDDLLYIGISKNFGRRWTEEAHSKPWWPDVQRQTVDWFGSWTEACAAEKVAIKSERPRYNIQHSEIPAAFRRPG